MADEFPMVPLGEVATVRSGFAFKSSDMGEHGVPIIKIKNITPPFVDTNDCEKVPEAVIANLPKSDRYLLEEGDILIAMTGATAGKVGRFPKTEVPYYLNQRVGKVYLTNPDRAAYRYLYFVLSQSTFVQLMFGLADGSAQGNFSGSQIENLEIPLPPLNEQQAIACILGALDDKIELNRRMNETLEGIARAIFKSWFVDYDPVHAKASARQPPGLAPNIAALFPDSFEKSELGEIPKGWLVKRIGDIAERVGMGPFGSSIKVETFVPKGIPIISGQHLRGFIMEDNAFNFIAHDHADRLISANVKRGDVILTHAGNIGQVAYIPENSRYERYVISQRQFFVRCDRSQAFPSFIALYLHSPEGQHRLLANTSSSGVPSIARPVTYLRSIPLTLPPKPIMDEFEKLVKPLLLKFRENLEASKILTALRDYLLPKLISGELRVPDAERIIGRCA